MYVNRIQLQLMTEMPFYKQDVSQNGENLNALEYTFFTRADNVILKLQTAQMIQ